MTSLRSITLLAFLALVPAGPVAAQGIPPAQWPAEVRAYHAARVQACRRFDNGRVSFHDEEARYVRTADFNGDGRPDYLLDAHGLSCSTAASLYCGNFGCEYTLFASQSNGRYVNAGDFMGEAELTVQDGRPVLRVGGGGPVWGWNGQALAILGARAAAQTPVRAPAAATVPAGGFIVDVTLNPEATAQMAAGSHQLLVSAYYYGLPARGYRGAGDEAGNINLGMDEAIAPGRSGRMVISGARLRRDLVRNVQGGRVMVSLGVQAARAAVLDCDAQDVPLAQVRARPAQINCRAFVSRRR